MSGIIGWNFSYRRILCRDLNWGNMICGMGLRGWINILLGESCWSVMMLEIIGVKFLLY